jgi:hypothetical protein
MAKNKKLWIDMCAGSELKDTQGETLSVEGANIDDLAQGKGRFNDNHGKGFFNSLGAVTEAKKIFKSEDCENERHTYYWEKIKAPFVYAKGYLYSDDDHPNARAAAAILRNIHREDTPLKMKASVEGGVLARGIKDPTRLARTKIHSVALTFTPANNATLVEPLNLDKADTDWDADKQLMKSVMHLSETNVPSFRHIERHASAHTIYENISKIQELAKSVGIELMIKEDIDPDTIMQKAVLNKISTNVSKINYLIKGAKNLSNVANMMKPAADTASEQTYTSPGKVQMAAENKAAVKATAQDKYQQGVGKLKSDPTTPMKPKDLNSTPDGTMKVKSANQVKHTNTFKGHASKAMKDPAHLNTVKQSLVDKGVSPNKIKTIMTRIQSHMQEPVKKSQDIEKGDIGRAAKNLVLAGAMGMGAHYATEPDSKDTVKEVKPKQQIERSIASDKPKEMSDEERNKIRQKSKEAKQWLRENTKTKLKKALTAGYGGAGSPGSLSGGGVIQAESLDDGRTKKADDGEFKYISCDNCGNEQVYMGHQVKCRKCRQNFNLNKLEDLI